MSRSCFDCKYFANSDRYEKHYYCQFIGGRLLAFDWYLHSILAYSIGQCQGHSQFDCEKIENVMLQFSVCQCKLLFLVICTMARIFGVMIQVSYTTDFDWRSNIWSHDTGQLYDWFWLTIEYLDSWYRSVIRLILTDYRIFGVMIQVSYTTYFVWLSNISSHDTGQLYDWFCITIEYLESWYRSVIRLILTDYGIFGVMI